MKFWFHFWNLVKMIDPFIRGFLWWNGNVKKYFVIPCKIIRILLKGEVALYRIISKRKRKKWNFKRAAQKCLIFLSHVKCRIKVCMHNFVEVLHLHMWNSGKGAHQLHAWTWKISLFDLRCFPIFSPVALISLYTCNTHPSNIFTRNEF